MFMVINDIATRQRLLNLAGFGPLKVDDIRGPKTIAAEKQWAAEQDLIIRDFGTLDARSEKNVLTLLPDFQRVARAWMLAHARPVAKDMGLTVKIICGTRDFEEQQRLYNQGRTTHGARVTNAKPGSSFHNYGAAFDICLFDSKGAPRWEDSLYKEFFSAAWIPAGCFWGGNFKSFKDYPHVETHAYGATISELKRLSK